MGRHEKVYINADWILFDPELIDSVPHMVARRIETGKFVKNLETDDRFNPHTLANVAIDYLSYDLDSVFEEANLETLHEIVESFSRNIRSACNDTPPHR